MGFTHSRTLGRRCASARPAVSHERLRGSLKEDLDSKTKRRDRGSAAKNVAPNSVGEYLAGVPEPARSTLNRVRAVIRSAVPTEATEAISFRIPTFKYKGSLLAFAAFSNHCGLYPMSSSVMEAFKNELKDFDASKGAIRFPVDKPLPAVLVKKLVRARIAENEHKKQR
jgi:uncharacterized protein YdhG (YjbR/CyaY superfamily)